MRELNAWWTIALSCAGVACSDDAPRWESIRDELIAMEKEDQAAREGLTVSSLGDTVRFRRMLTVDSANTQRLREIIEAYGWPRISDVGEEAAHAAWLLLQHASDTALQRQMLRPLEDAAERGEASRSSLALLTDRVLIHQDKPQRYGTQFKFEDGRLVFHPIEAPEAVDERRASVGLPPLEEYRRMAEDLYQARGTDTLSARRDSV
jgi:hypothetical protein